MLVVREEGGREGGKGRKGGREGGREGEREDCYPHNYRGRVGVHVRT